MVEQAVIIAGGRGTRLAPFTDSNPKPMYPINGKPFLEYLINQVSEFGIRRIVLLLGYLPNKIEDYFGNGRRWGLDIQYDMTPESYETGDRMKHASYLLDEEFLFMYCDNYCPIDYLKLAEDFYRNQAEIQISAYANKDGYTRSNLTLRDSDGKVLVYDKSRQRKDNLGVDIGYSIIKKEVLSRLKNNGENFEKEVYPQLVEDGKLYATITEHRYYSIGSWERIDLTEAFFNNTPTVFLDRDGTLNEKPPQACYIEKPEDFVWIDGAIEAIRLLKNHGWRVIIVTNQPGIARGNLTLATLGQIHEKMKKDLANAGISGGIDDIFYCPHNWDEGCKCRKPKPGMLYEAQKKYSLNLSKCLLIGDDDRDIEAGKAARCQCLKVSVVYKLIEAVRDLIDGRAIFI